MRLHTTLLRWVCIRPHYAFLLHKWKSYFGKLNTILNTLITVAHNIKSVKRADMFVNYVCAQSYVSDWLLSSNINNLLTELRTTPLRHWELTVFVLYQHQLLTLCKFFNAVKVLPLISDHDLRPHQLSDWYFRFWRIPHLKWFSACLYLNKQLIFKHSSCNLICTMHIAVERDLN